MRFGLSDNDRLCWWRSLPTSVEYEHLSKALFFDTPIHLLEISVVTIHICPHPRAQSCRIPGLPGIYNRDRLDRRTSGTLIAVPCHSLVSRGALTRWIRSTSCPDVVLPPQLIRTDKMCSPRSTVRRRILRGQNSNIELTFYLKPLTG